MSTLTDSLLSEFARATNDKPEKKKEYTAFGTVNSVSNDGTVQVILDGSEIPITCKATVALKKDDRVIVSIKNRQATVTSNATQKSINTDYLESEGAVFKWYNPIARCYDIVEIGAGWPGPFTVKEENSKAITVISLNHIELMENYIDEDAGYVTILGSSGMSVYGYSDGTECHYNSTGQDVGSDRRIKERIEDLEWEPALKLRPVSFYYSKSPHTKHLGFIAQEVQEVHPDAVSETKQYSQRKNNHPGMLTLNYQELIAPTLALAQHNHDEIEALKRRIEELERRLENVESEHN